jgi:OmpA-OmpF porin, OOP family
MNWIRKAVPAIGIGLAVMAPSAALAQGVLGGPDSAWYAGGSIGQSASNLCQLPLGGTCEDQGTAYRLLGGYQVNRYLSLELGYSELADLTVTAGPLLQTLETTVFDLVVLGMLPLTGKVGAYGKLGLYRANSTATSNVPGLANAKVENTGLTYAVGAQFDVTRNLGIRMEWQQYAGVGGMAFTGNSDYTVTSLGAVWRFK